MSPKPPLRETPNMCQKALTLDNGLYQEIGKHTFSQGRSLSGTTAHVVVNIDVLAYSNQVIERIDDGCFDGW